MPYYKSYLNSFVPNAPFLYFLKKSENRFQGVEKGWIGNKWVNLRGVFKTLSNMKDLQNN